MAMMTAYFDDRGTHLQSEIAVAACFLSDVTRWNQFQLEWELILEEAGISATGFHMADFVARKAPFDDWQQVKRDLIIKRFVDTIIKYALAGMATAVFKSAYDKHVKGQLREKLGHHHYTFAVQSCLAYIEKRRHLHADWQPMDYVFDAMSNGKHEIINLFDDIHNQGLGMHFGVLPHCYSFGNRRAVVPLQAADILAWETFKHMKHHELTGKPARKSFQSMANGIEIHSRFFDDESMATFVADVTPKYEGRNWNAPLGGFL
jgi:hypothetical protein